MEKPLVNKKLKLEKYPGKGGWTYARIPGVKPDPQNHFGWVRVKGFIDDHAINSYNLAPMGNGSLFLPVKKAIRKIIKKEAGDWVKVVLYRDNDPVHIPGELLECLRDEPEAHKTFHKLSETAKKQYIDWIYSAKTEKTRVERLAETVNRLLRGLLLSNT